MSFAATAALVGVFAALRSQRIGAAWPSAAKWALALFMSSFVAGGATAPFAAAHFNQIAVFGLIANLLTVPVMASVVIPGAVVAALLTPLGLALPLWWVMEGALIWILAVAATIAAWPGAVQPVPTPPGWVLGVVSMGALVVLLWQGGLRWLGAVPILVALFQWPGEGRPSVLISDTGGQVGVLMAEGRALSRDRGDGFVARVWLEDDGDRTDQAGAAARPFWRADTAGQTAEIAGWRLWHATGRRAPEAVAAACATHDIVILSEAAPDAARTLANPSVALTGPSPVALTARGGCLILDRALLRQTGAVAIMVHDGALIITSARMHQGTRLWSPAP
jgi:competence protein ComEC